MRVPKTRKRAKAPAKYQSKKNRSLKWSGRGMLPVWMREEMKGTKLDQAGFSRSRARGAQGKLTGARGNCSRTVSR